MQLVCGHGVETSVILGCLQLGWPLITCLSVPSPGLPQYMKSLRWALVVMAVLLAICTVAVVALASRGGMLSHPCSVYLQHL